MKTHSIIRIGGITPLAIATSLALFTANAFASFSGTAVGTFENPDPSSGVTDAGVGTSMFTWGVQDNKAGPNKLVYLSTPFSGALAENQFQLGTLTYFNGTTTGNLPNTVDLDLTVNFTDPSGVSQDFAYTMQLITTPNTDNADQSADYVVLSTFPSTTFTAGGTTYTLAMSFGDLSGGGFIQSGNELHVLENDTATAKLLGTITANTEGVVPEASTFFAGALLLLPFGLQAARRLRNS